MAALLDVSDVTLRYKTSSAVVTATERVSFTVDRSDRFVLLGPSGCGKSTLLKAVGGYMAPSEGKMRISGREISEPGADRMMIFQEFDQLLPWKTVLENVMFPLLMTRRLPRKDAEMRARAYIEKVRADPGRDRENGEDRREDDAGGIAHEQHLQRRPGTHGNGAVDLPSRGEKENDHRFSDEAIVPQQLQHGELALDFRRRGRGQVSGIAQQYPCFTHGALP